MKKPAPQWLKKVKRIEIEKNTKNLGNKTKKLNCGPSFLPACIGCQESSLYLLPYSTKELPTPWPNLSDD
jgi:hypothetical protein